MASQPKTCAACDKQLRKENISGYCAQHIHEHVYRKPEMRQRIARTLQMRHLSDPDVRATNSAILAKAREKLDLKAASERFKAAKHWIAGNACRPAGSPARKQAGARGSATKLAWCPPHLRPEYLFLTKKKRLYAAEARAIIEGQHEVEMRRWRQAVGADQWRNAAA